MWYIFWLEICKIRIGIEFDRLFWILYEYFGKLRFSSSTKLKKKNKNEKKIIQKKNTLESASHLLGNETIMHFSITHNCDEIYTQSSIRDKITLS